MCWLPILTINLKMSKSTYFWGIFGPFKKVHLVFLAYFNVQLVFTKVVATKNQLFGSGFQLYKKMLAYFGV